MVVKRWLCLCLWHRKQLRGLQQTSVHTAHSTMIRTDAWLPSQPLGEGQSWSRKKTSPRDPGQPLSALDVGLSNIILKFVCLKIHTQWQQQSTKNNSFIKGNSIASSIFSKNSIFLNRSCSDLMNGEIIPSLLPSKLICSNGSWATKKQRSIIRNAGNCC